MTTSAQRNSAELEAIAADRSKFYETATGIVSTLPDEDFLESLVEGGLEPFLTNCGTLDNTDANRGVSDIHSYIRGIDRDRVAESAADLAIDRTRLFRFHGDNKLNPPYEGHYSKSATHVAGNTILKVKSFYRWAGIIPSDNCPESPDYLSVELDFMRMLCLREKSEWEANKDARNTVSMEFRFLREHLGCWISRYCQQAENAAATNFYRGFVIVLNAMIKQETQYLAELRMALKSN